MSLVKLRCLSIDSTILLLTDYIPNGVRLTAYSGGADDMPGDVLQAFINAVEAEKVSVPIDRVYTMDQIVDAHAYMVSRHMISLGQPVTNIASWWITGKR